MSLSPAQPLTGQAPARKIRVLVVDDSAVIRGLVTRWLSGEADIEVVGAAVNGKDGVDHAEKHKPDLIILDIEMPVMDGVTALPAIRKVAPNARVIMASTLTQRGAEVTIKALAAGASDYIPKPDASQLAGAADYKRELLAKVRSLGARAVSAANPSPAYGAAAASSSAGRPPAPAGPTLRAVTQKVIPEAIFIGSSTGGPEALREVIEGLAGKVRVPVFITQHMPPMFTKILADHLTKQTKATVVEATDGLQAQPGVFYIAPGDRHMIISRNLTVTRISLSDAPPENFCRPAVDPMFRSAAETYGEKALAVVLTGMGQDGLLGAKPLVSKGAQLIAQDEETSVVWGMPGAIARAGLATACKPIQQIAPAILNVMRGVSV
ncbi:chemotaxis response regulator protein-glutamate methylesterase [Aquidulcibacter sp.]|uniref:protein-glutamate methylesterase/protein-glutamine glutaminase n=1 Tax=Aquidulcibacter sp. TaxID=2052990 RepID=UPI0025C26FFF|nr:chemotaxis response regulator protein-glutamate methylesterase [Aquidulcibacter sp.]MCA3692277.1 chemotaxis response regulator protein-glutamate methylesterase [Aquidulcibacter sp.]